jgi:hypothetical protein
MNDRSSSPSKSTRRSPLLSSELKKPKLAEVSEEEKQEALKLKAEANQAFTCQCPS